jgi:hypothetical protein
VGGATLAACGDDTVTALPEAGTGADATTVEASVEASTEDVSLAEASCAVDAGPLDDAQVAAGQQLVGTHKCHNCHGDALSGNNDGVPSMTAEGGTAYPPNLTPDPATGLGCWTNDQIANAILNGIDNEGMPLCNPMPVFGHLAGDAGLTQTQAQEVVQYLRSLPAVVNNVPDTPDCPVPPEVEAGPDATPDASPEAGVDAATDAGGSDTGSDGGIDATLDAPTEAAPEASTEAGDDGGESTTDSGVEGGD